MVRALGHAFVVCGVCLSSDCVWACSKGYSFSVWLVVRLVIVAPCGWVRFICLPRGRRRGLAMSRLLVLLVRLGWVRWCHQRARGRSLVAFACNGDVGAGPALWVVLLGDVPLGDA